MKVILITGVSRGIGLSILKKSINLQPNVRIVGLSRTPLERCETELKDLINRNQENIVYIKGDITDESVMKNAISTAVSKWGRLDSIVLNAGVLEPLQRIRDCDLSQWKRAFDVNFFSCLSACKLAIPELKKVNGRIILVSSGAATNAYVGWGAYCMSKAALNMLGQCLAAEEEDITTVCVRPGVVDTQMQDIIRKEGGTVMKSKQFGQFTALKEEGKLLHPDEPAEAIAKMAVIGVKHEWSGKFVNWDECGIVDV